MKVKNMVEPLEPNRELIYTAQRYSGYSGTSGSTGFSGNSGGFSVGFNSEKSALRAAPTTPIQSVFGVFPADSVDSSEILVPDREEPSDAEKDKDNSNVCSSSVSGSKQNSLPVQDMTIKSVPGQIALDSLPPGPPDKCDKNWNCRIQRFVIPEITDKCPVGTKCPYCGFDVVTITAREPNSTACIFGTFLCFTLGPIFACIPCCICTSVQHTCPLCDGLIAEV